MSDPWEHQDQTAQPARVEAQSNFITTMHISKPKGMTMNDAPAPTVQSSPTMTGLSPKTPTADTEPEADAATTARAIYTSANNDTFVIMANCINTYNSAKARLSTTQYCAEDARRLLDMMIIALDVPNVDQYRK